MNRKIFAYMLIVLLVTESMFFQFYIAANEVHHCSESHCPVCLVLHEANTVLNQLAGGILPVTALFCVIYLIGNIIATDESFVEPRTLIKWKVRMDH